MVLGNIVQVIISLFLVLILAFIGYAVFNNESLSALKNFNNIKKEIPIFRGVADFKNNNGGTYDTKDKSLSSYLDLKPSINQYGGAEYTYNFWLYRDSSLLNSSLQSEDIALILRGSKMKLRYNSPHNCLLKNNKSKYILVKNPLIRMKRDGSSIVVEYNSISFPDTFHDGGAAEIGNNCSSWFDKNKGLLGIYDLDASFDKNWFMVTVVLQEISPDNNILYKNKTTCKMYINGVLMLDRIVESPYDTTTNNEYSAAMRHNRGPLYVNPGGIYGTYATDGSGTFTATDNIATEGALRMADLTYYNYAIDAVEIEQLYKAGFTKGAAPMPSADVNDPTLNNIAPAVESGPKAF